MEQELRSDSPNAGQQPKHSGFYSATLDILLDYLQAKTLILAGITANICVLFTANDAYLRDYDLVVPRDCVASASDEENRYALEQIGKVLKADTRRSAEISLEMLAGEADSCDHQSASVTAPTASGRSLN